MNFLWDGPLASLQDNIFNQLMTGQEISEKDYKKLKRSIPVKIAEILAPCNLVVRNYCLLDLISGQNKHQTKIFNLCLKMCGTSNMSWADKLWQEGHSYWGYTRYILKVYGQHFNEAWVTDCINTINNNFRRTSYERDGISYPAPFGDIWNIPLENELQQPKDKSNCGPIRIELPIIKVNTNPLGLNLHTTYVNTVYDTTSGIPVNMQTDKPFKFYQGYKEKYPHVWNEIWAMLSIRRLLSVLHLLFNFK